MSIVDGSRQRYQVLVPPRRRTLFFRFVKVGTLIRMCVEDLSQMLCILPQHASR